MAVYKIKRFSFKDKFKGAMKGAALGASIGSLAATPLAFDAVADKQLGVEPKTALKGVLGAGIIGATVGAYKGWKNAKSTPQLSASKLSSIKVDEPTNLEELFRKYPKLREMESIIENKEVFKSISLALDLDLGSEDFSRMTLAEDLKLFPEYKQLKLWDNTKFIREKMGSQDWIACIGNVYFNTKDNKFYFIFLGRNIQKREITLKKYIESIIQDIQRENSIYPELIDNKDINKLKQLCQRLR